MLRKHAIWLVAAVLALGFAVSTQAREHGLVYLGNAHVDGNVDHDNIRVSRNDGRFRGLQLQVEDAAIDFQRVVVHYGNGSSQELPVREHIPAGGRTRIIDLPGNRRDIDSVELWYSRGGGSRHRPKVNLFGVR